MNAILLHDFEALCATPVTEQNEAVLRETLHRILNRIHLSGSGRIEKEEFQTLTQMAQDCYRRLRALENLTICGRRQATPARCDITAFLRELFCACDLLLGVCGRRFTARLPRGRIRLTCDAPLLRSALLNLLANALQYGSGAPSLRVRETESGMVFCVSAHSVLTPEQFRRATIGSGGLRTVTHIVRLHGGRLMLGMEEEKTHLAFSIPRNLTEKEEPVPIPSFSDYICDRLSPLYTGLCGICPCPV